MLSFPALVDFQILLGIISSLSTAVDIAAGGMHTVVLNSDGEVFTFGCNDEGRITISLNVNMPTIHLPLLYC